MDDIRVMGVDPALVTTGFSIVHFKDNEVDLDFVDTFTSDGSLQQPHRIAGIFSHISWILSEKDVDEVAAEATVYMHNVKTAIKLGEARGGILIAPAIMEIPVYEMSPTNVKKVVTGTGNAGKDQVAEEVNGLLGTDIDKRDITDSIACAMTHAHNSDEIEFDLEKLKE